MIADLDASGCGRGLRGPLAAAGRGPATTLAAAGRGRPQRTPSSILTGTPGYAHITPPTEYGDRREPMGEILPKEWPIVDP
ncbi:hypothetical protein E1258_02745 [Micromonospora sp. KC207]|uniref:hypothetical protein n=1 Tax=Micromonospora sp. KC207 TaxID=2530377 RepID=UPI001051FAF3|nr:hypothetical protein [Micromonospora sp. KC207]TDC66384.1 hypothetical protein E1258_02745 [Micromonospora sp. KC207]